MAARGRWAGPARLLVCRRTGLGGSRLSRGPAGDGLRRVVGRLLRASSRRERRGSPVCSLREQCHRRGAHAAGPRGAREARVPCRLPRDFAERRIGLLRIQGDATPEKSGIESQLRLQSSDGALGKARLRAVKLLSTQIVGNTRRKQIHLERQRQHCIAKPSSTLAKSMKSCRCWQRRSLSEDAPY